MNDFIPFSCPEITSDEINEVIGVLKSGWLTSGPKVIEFEEEFVRYLDSDVQALAVNSATSGLHLALEAVGISQGDEVIVPSLTFTATAEVVRYLGAEVTIVDIDPKTLNISIESIKKAITKRTKAIIAVHFAGLSCDMDSIFLLARENGLKVIEDAAHALSTEYKGKKIGTLGSDATVFSFYANKNITTGEGGMIISRNKDLISRMKIMRLHGIDRDVYDRFNSKKPSWFYEVISPGYKYNMTDIAAAIGIHQLRKLPDFLKKRDILANRYYDDLADLPIVLPNKGSQSDIHSWHLFTLILNNTNISRDEVIKVFSENGIGTSVHYIPLHKQPYWKKRYSLQDREFPVSENVYNGIFSIPLYSLLTFKQQDKIVRLLRSVLE